MRIIIFDLDDTLISSDAKIKVYDSKNNEVLTEMSPSQFNYRVNKIGEYLCFNDFECEKILGRSKLHQATYRSFKRYYDRGVHVGIVTARSNKKIVIDFFKEKGYPLKPSLVYAVHDPKLGFHGNIAERKKKAFEDLIKKGYDDLTFYEDNAENLKAVESLSYEHPSIKLKTILVKHAN